MQNRVGGPIGRALAAAAAFGGVLMVAGATTVEARGQETSVAGATLFKTYCATCHGAGGRGDGPVAPHLRKPPADLTTIAKRNGGTYPAEAVSKTIDGRTRVAPHGSTDMPVWGDAFSRTTTENDEASVRRKIEALVRYIETVQEAPDRK